jgi:predicted  nucleic acid-binding Zn-ribbon protein
MKEGRIALLKCMEEVRSGAESLPENISGPVKELVRSIESEEIKIEDDSKEVHEPFPAINKLSRELQREISEWEDKREKLVSKLQQGIQVES